MTVRVETLARKHRALLGDFQNQHASLADYLKRFALRHAERDLLSRTFVALDETAQGTRVAGYFSLATVSVERTSVDAVVALAHLPRFPMRRCCSPDSRWTVVCKGRVRGATSSKKPSVERRSSRPPGRCRPRRERSVTVPRPKAT